MQQKSKNENEPALNYLSVISAINTRINTFRTNSLVLDYSNLFSSFYFESIFAEYLPLTLIQKIQ